MKHYHPTPPGWKREYQCGRGLRFVHAESGRYVTRPLSARHWFIYASDGTKNPQPYRTWLDAVREADESLRKERVNG